MAWPASGPQGAGWFGQAWPARSLASRTEPTMLASHRLSPTRRLASPSFFPLLLLMVAGLLLGGCSVLRFHKPPPSKLESQVRIPGMPGVRAWGDQFSQEFQDDMIESIRQEHQSGLFQPNTYVDILAISGGGGDGAFGAGLLCGWTEAGNRPRFKLVTGISTGALTAPFAFLGPAYDPVLREVYTSINSSDIFEFKLWVNLLGTDSIGFNDPLARLAERYVDGKLLRDIAAEHAKGRRLYIGTTALDAQRPVIWNMGAIAASGHPGALELFRKVMIASAAVPVAFPPTYFKVEADGQRYDEMHVDGGVANQVFMYGSTLDMEDGIKQRAFAGHRQPRVFIVRNTRLKPAWESIHPLLSEIAPRSMSTLIRSQGVGDLYRIFTFAQRDGVDFNLGYIPDQMDINRSDEFDTRVMNVLFETGYKLARHGYRWQKEPPGYFPAGRGNGYAPARLKLVE